MEKILSRNIKFENNFKTLQNNQENVTINN